MRIIVMVVCLVLGTGFTSNVIGGRDLSDFEIDGITSWILLESLNNHLKIEGSNLRVQKINDFEVVEQGQKLIFRGRQNVYLVSANVTLDNNVEMESLSHMIVSRTSNEGKTDLTCDYGSMLEPSKNNTYYRVLAELKEWVHEKSN